MDCSEIQELLSEYIDGTLDAKAVQVVEKHISFCQDCKETHASLREMVEELNALEPMKAPADFLEKIHQRMEPRSVINRLFKKLFVPFKIKIPLQLAAAATASILVVMVISLQQSEYQKMQPLKSPKSEWFAEKSKADHLTPGFKKKTKPPALVLEEAPERLSDSEQDMPAQRFRVKTRVQSSAQRQSEPSSSVVATARPFDLKDQPLEIALVLKPVVAGSGYLPDNAMQTMPLSEGDKKTKEKEKTDKDVLEGNVEAGKKSRVEQLLLRINHIILPIKGKILTKEYHKQKDRLTSIHVQIPANNYASFIRELKRLATFKTPPPALLDQRLETVNLLIHFTYPE